MQLYFSPLACSLATRIALYEAGAPASFIEVDPRTKRTLGDDQDFRAIHPLGLVPTLRTDDGELLTENAAILQHVARQFPAAELAPPDAPGRARLQQWLSFISTELHKGVFSVLFDRAAPEAVKAYVLGRVTSRFAYLSTHLADREHLLERFSVADAYLVTVLNWTQATPIRLADWPVLDGYLRRVRARPSVAKAMREERTLYAAELARHETA